VPSIASASSGACTPAPIASIRPWRITIVPEAMGGPATVISRAFLTA